MEVQTGGTNSITIGFEVVKLRRMNEMIPGERKESKGRCGLSLSSLVQPLPTAVGLFNSRLGSLTSRKFSYVEFL